MALFFDEPSSASGSGKERSVDEDEDEDVGPAPPIEARFPLDIHRKDFSIYELHRRWTQRSLVLNPDFQREFVWKPEKQIKLVESVMANIPLPAFYFWDDGELLEVIDGQQRLTSLFAFMEGRLAEKNETPIRRRGADPGKGRPFRLDHLRLVKELEGRDFESLGSRERRKFEETQLSCFVLGSTTNEQAKFELFERINEGATPLNPQEIRNALYRGPGLSLVNELGGRGSRFRQVAGLDREWTRSRAEELVLRGVAMSHGRCEDVYKGDLKGFLNENLVRLNSEPPAELDRVRRAFLHAIDFAELIFPDGKAWQRFDPVTGAYSRHISGPLVEVVTVAAGRVFPDGLPDAARADRIRARFIELCREPKFMGAILNATQTTASVKARVKVFEGICRDA